jgi:hypothetical protein
VGGLKIGPLSCVHIPMSRPSVQYNIHSTRTICLDCVLVSVPSHSGRDNYWRIDIRLEEGRERQEGGGSD